MELRMHHWLRYALQLYCPTVLCHAVICNAPPPSPEGGCV